MNASETVEESTENEGSSEEDSTSGGLLDFSKAFTATTPAAAPTDPGEDLLAGVDLDSEGDPGGALGGFGDLEDPEDESWDSEFDDDPNGLFHRRGRFDPWAMEGEPSLIANIGLEGDAGIDKLMVHRWTDRGDKQHLDYLPADASMWALVERGSGRPGAYLLTPCDEHGRPLQKTAKRVEIAPDHPAVLAYQQKKSSGPSAPSVGYGSGSPDVWLEHFSEVSTSADEKLERAFETRNQSAEFLVSEFSQMVGSQVENERQRSESQVQMLGDLFSNVTREQDRAAERRIQAEERRNDHMLAAQEQTHQTLMQMMIASQERERVREEKAAERERVREERQRELDRERQKEREREKDSYLKLQLAMMQQDRERDRQALERDRQRQDELFRIRMESVQAQNPMNLLFAATNVLPTLTQSLGLDGKDLVGLGKSYLGIEDRSEDRSITGELFETVREGIRSLPDLAKTFGEMGNGRAAPWEQEREEDWDLEEEEEEVQPTPQPSENPPPPSLPQSRASEYGLGSLEAMARLQQQQAQQAAHQAQQAATQPPIYDPAGPPSNAAPGVQYAATPDAQHTAPGAQHTAPGAQHADNQTDQINVQPQSQQPASIDVSAARQAVKWVFEQVESHPTEKWIWILKEAASQGPASDNLMAYLEARTIRGAARDAGAPDRLIEAFITEIDKYPQTHSIPRGA